MEPFTLALILGLLGAAASGAGAIAQNRALSASADSQKRAAEVSSRQVEAQARQQGIELARESARLRGTVLARENADASLLPTIDSDLGYNLSILDANRENSLTRIASGLEAQLTDLSGRRLNPLLSTLEGGLSGATTGLSLQSGLSALSASKPAPTFAKGFVGPIP